MIVKVVSPDKPKKATVVGVSLTNYRSGKVLQVMVQLNFKGSYVAPNYVYYSDTLPFRFDSEHESLADLKAKVVAAWKNHDATADVGMANLVYMLEQYSEA